MRLMNNDDRALLTAYFASVLSDDSGSDSEDEYSPQVDWKKVNLGSVVIDQGRLPSVTVLLIACKIIWIMKCFSCYANITPLN